MVGYLRYLIGFHSQLFCHTTNIDMPSSFDNNKPILISIITVCLNEEERIEQTLQSVISQNYSSKEYIVIDGGSTDDTVEIIKRHSSHIDYFISENDQGIYDAMNKGASLAKGQYLIFMNGGDTFYNSDVLKKVFLSQSHSEDLLYGDTKYIYPETDNWLMAKHPKKINIHYLAHNTLNHQSTFFKKSFFIKAGMFTTQYKISGDYDFFLRAFINHKCTYKYLQTPISCFFKDGISSKKENQNVMNKELLELHEKYLPRLIYIISKIRIFLIENKNIFPLWSHVVINRFYATICRPGKPYNKK